MAEDDPEKDVPEQDQVQQDDPPPARPPLYIPVKNGLPPSLWLGTTNGD